MLNLLLSRIANEGTLAIIHANGRQEIFGSGSPSVCVKLHDAPAQWELLLNPDLKLGELYMDGRLSVERGNVADLLGLLMSNLSSRKYSALRKLWRRLGRLMRGLAQHNSSGHARAHVAHHYDLPPRLYELFLGRDRQYSCAYFSAPGETLEQAQIGKKRHIAAKLNLNRPGLKVLDIGCGWGGLALNLAQDFGAEVLGVTLSEEQIAIARDRAQNLHLADLCRFELADYRTLRGIYDRLVSVGMFEHVGVPYYDVFFGKVRDLLADNGVMLLHTIGRSDGPACTNSWIAKYIFPGGYVPALSEIMTAIERSGLVVTDIEVLRLHYADTLKEWRRRFAVNRADVARIMGERFCRMWEFYLASAEMAFRYDNKVVFQIQLAKRVDALPLTRDYMVDVERSMRFAGVERLSRPLQAG
jgi:cyclopropane-fatty-acyl-phospholipid synthase